MKLSQVHWDAILHTLTHEQVEYLNSFVLQEKQTFFRRMMALRKHLYVTSAMTQAELSRITQTDWEFLSMKTRHSNEDLKCDCGSSIQTQYTIKHPKTGHVRHVGEEHFGQHIGIPKIITDRIVDEFQTIDNEYNSVIKQIGDGVPAKLPYELENDLFIPYSIRHHIQLGIPLFRRQVSELNMIVYGKRMAAQHLPTTLQDAIGASLSNEEQSAAGLKTNNLRELPLNLCNDALRYLQEDVHSVAAISELLIQECNAPPERYASYKPVIYPLVAMYYERLVFIGMVKRERSFIDDCTYAVNVF